MASFVPEMFASIRSYIDQIFYDALSWIIYLLVFLLLPLNYRSLLILKYNTTIKLQLTFNTTLLLNYNTLLTLNYKLAVEQNSQFTLHYSHIFTTQLPVNTSFPLYCWTIDPWYITLPPCCKRISIIPFYRTIYTQPSVTPLYRSVTHNYCSFVHSFSSRSHGGQSLFQSELST
jgi:hypothetical protein